ncbi:MULTISPECIES: HAD family hydrolase [unclassified Pseudoalteromonas]|uniref:HAD family hydrolase n=1 Tax=unclassified Pseudoalteromonas TaxID=194690 RepID=UPI000CF67085|nr:MULTISPECIES: HAD-IA family hydrolase [unclassified Pseudoalteromonas]
MSKYHNVPLRGVIFDMDGTLFSSQLDFALIRKQINCAHGEDILEFITRLDSDGQRHAEQVILDHELADAEQAVLLPQVAQSLASLHKAQIPMAIVTRNSEQATGIKMSRNPIPIDLVLTRDDAPAKPNPSALLHIAERWQMPVQHLLYVGDYKYDIQAAHNANMRACLYAPHSIPDYAAQADYVIRCFSELPALVELC